MWKVPSEDGVNLKRRSEEQGGLLSQHPTTKTSGDASEKTKSTQAPWVFPTEDWATLRSTPSEAWGPVQFDVKPQPLTDPVQSDTQDHRKRRKTEDIVYHERKEALHSSPVHLATPIEQEDKILIAQDVGKSYRLAAKDYSITIRDSRIRAKDKEIAELGNQIKIKDALILDATSGNVVRDQHIAELDQVILDQQHQVDTLYANIDEHVRNNERSIQAIEEQDTQLRLLYNELMAQNAEVQSLKDRRLFDQILRWIQSVNRNVSPSPSFPFLRLPGELRNQVYALCLVSPHAIDFWPMQPIGVSDTDFDRMAIYKKAIKSININLLFTSRQVHHEAASVLYGLNRFRFSDRGGWPLLYGFLHHVNSNYKFLTNITIGFPVWCSIKHGEYFADPAIRSRLKVEKQAMLHRFGNSIFDSPTGPQSDNHTAWIETCKLLLRIPLKHFTIVVPHDVQLPAYALDKVFSMLTEDSDQFALTGTFFSPTRYFIFLQRHHTQSNSEPGHDVDDDLFMGRSHLRRLCHRSLRQLHKAAFTKMGEYGRVGEGVSFFVHGGEVGFEVITADEADEAGEVRQEASGFVKGFLAARRFLGY